MSIGEKLKNLRKNAHNTLKESSEVFGVSLNTVHRWEHDMCAPKKSMLRKIAEHYDVPYEWLARTDKSGKPVYCNGCVLNMDSDNSTEQKILKILKKLSAEYKYKILGYVERMRYEHDFENL